MLRFAFAAALTLTVLAAGCAKSSTAPSPPPPTPDPLALACPSPVTQTSPSGQPISLRYGAATATGGTPPVQITCTPPNDSAFPVGQTTVTCTGTDSRNVTSTCSFTVTIAAPPRLQATATSFAAFGDSITAGEITVQGEGRVHIQTIRDDLSYPTDLRQSLTGRYTAQTVQVANRGVKGETTSDGLSRLPSVLSANYQVLLLLEGANDINDTLSGAARDRALGNIRSMVRLARGRGLRVFLATLPPQNPLACCPRRGTGDVLVPSYNDGIRGIAATEGATLVDVFNAFGGDVTTLIGPDGLHPTAAGYQVIATAFFNAIRATLEEAPPPSLTALPAMPSAVPPRIVVPKRK
jgi:lysophospholipase L1-like esterase